MSEIKTIIVRSSFVNNTMLEILNNDEIVLIAKECGFSKVLNWSLEEFPNKVVGYLGDYLKLTIEVESRGNKSKLCLFVKCMPSDKWRAQLVTDLTYFKKEYIMMSQLFKKFKRCEGLRKWSPKLLFIKEEVFVFENVSELGYAMPHHQCTMSFDTLRASVQTMARFHAQSYIYEEKKTIELGRPYRIWEDYREYIEKPTRAQTWRTTGRNAVIDFLNVYSKFKGETNFSKQIQVVIKKLFDDALALASPSIEFRNAVIHTDLWTNNIFTKKINNIYHVLFVDFQAVLYCSPMNDLSSMIFYNTTRGDRYSFTEKLIDVYYNTLTDELRFENINVNDIIDKPTLIKCYKESVKYGITKAALIVPIIAMNDEQKEQIFYNPKTIARANDVTRSEEFIEIAKDDPKYRKRVQELFEEIVERYVYPNESDQDQGFMSY